MKSHGKGDGVVPFIPSATIGVGWPQSFGRKKYLIYVFLFIYLIASRAFSSHEVLPGVSAYVEVNSGVALMGSVRGWGWWTHPPVFTLTPELCRPNFKTLNVGFHFQNLHMYTKPTAWGQVTKGSRSSGGYSNCFLLSVMVMFSTMSMTPFSFFLPFALLLQPEE